MHSIVYRSTIQIQRILIRIGAIKTAYSITDTLVNTADLEPRALEEEIEFILNTAGSYLTKEPRRVDVKSIFAGLRPLATPEGDNEKSTKEISRHHKVLISLSGLITLTGGKWTTYRKMGEDAVDKAILLAGLPERKSITENLMIHSYSQNVSLDDPNSVYGNDIKLLEDIVEEDSGNKELLSEELKISKAQLILAIREEMTRTVEDFLARRTRALFLDARESIKMCNPVANIMAKEIGFDNEWINNQIEQYTALAQGYYLA